MEMSRVNKKLVSVISPCYNGESFAERFFENILEQTYPNIELIFVDDGSADKTGEIARAYIPRFKDRGYELIYIYQENAGQAAAVNKGLKIFKGEYLMWTDSDDLLDADNIAKKVAYLESHPECDYVMCRGRVVNDSDISKKTGELKRVQPQGEDDMLTDLILEKNVVFTPGVYLVRGEAFLAVNPEREIIESRLGQNWQLLLPLAYKCKCGYIKEELFSYIVRDDSHSRQEKTLDQVFLKLKGHNDLLKEILKQMGLEGSKYWNMLNVKHLRKQFDNAYHYHNKKVLREKYRQLKQSGGVTKRDTLIYYAGMYKVVDWGYSLFKLVKNYLRSKQ